MMYKDNKPFYYSLNASKDRYNTRKIFRLNHTYQLTTDIGLNSVSSDSESLSEIHYTERLKFVTNRAKILCDVLI